MSRIPSLKMNTGAKIPAIGFGTWRLSEGSEVKQAVGEALKAGYRLVDTAKVYGNEKGVGEAIRASALSRKEIFVTTKLWPSDFGYGSALKAFEESIQKMGLEYIDLYLIHWPGHSSKNRHQSWEALSKLYKDGQSKAIGVSNFTVEHLEELLESFDIVPAVNQIEFHPFIYDKQAEVLEFCKQRGIVVEAYTPLANGRHLDNPLVLTIAKKHSKSSSQILLRWAIGHGTVPIPKSARLDRIKENLKVFDFELSGREMEALDHLGRGKSALPLYVRLLK